MRLVSFDDGAGERLAVEHDDGRIRSGASLGDGLPATMMELLGGGDAAIDELRAAAAAADERDQAGDVDAATRIAPVPRPGKIIAIGLNYHSHAVEGGVDPPERPMLFCKFSTSVVGDGDTVEWDPALTSGVDLEVELAVVIGRTARHVRREDALAYVAGYTIINDVSARDLQFSDGQFVRSKSLDTFCPMGPVVVTADEIPDPAVLAISSSLNGEPMQSSTTSDLIFDVPEIIAFCSQAFTLEPGDVITTGTPAGVGWFREPRIVMHDGDLMTCEIERIGRLTNPCREVAAG